jgi:hypothetical protein
MHDITGTERVAEGILLRIATPSGGREVAFGFDELIRMEINALHILQYPHKYLCDPDARIIRRRGR